MGITKYFKLFGLFKDIQEEWKKEKGINRPVYMSRGFWAAVFIFLAFILKALFAVEVSMDVDTFVNHALTISSSVATIIPAISAIYGVIMGVFKAMKALRKQNVSS